MPSTHVPSDSRPPATRPRRRASGVVVLAAATTLLLFAEATVRQPAHAAGASTATARPTIQPMSANGLFAPDQPVTFAVGAAGTPALADVGWRITDARGVLVEAGDAVVGSSGRAEIRPTRRLNAGTYRVTAHGPALPETSFRFVRTPGVEHRDAFFNVTMNGSPGPVAAALPTLDGLGAAGFRQDLQWSTVEKVPGVFDFRSTDARVDPIVRDRGVAPLFVLDYGHMAYTGGAMTPPDVSDPAQTAAWRRFVSEAVTHVRDRYPDADRSFEIWNEWTNTHGTRSADPAAYIALSRVTAATIRSVDPEARIVGPAEDAVSSGELRWLDEWFRLGGADHIDAISVHPYNQPYAPEHCVATNPCIENALRWLRDKAAKYPRANGEPLPIWITEVGWPTPNGRPGWVSEDDQAAFLVRTHVLAAQYGVERVFSFEMAAPDQPDPDGSARTFGLVDAPSRAYEPKPAAAAYATMQRQLAGMRFAGQFVTGAVREARFVSADGTRSVRVVWQTADRFDELPISVGLPGDGTIVDAYGGTKAVRGTGGKLAMSATWKPRFVVWNG
ncbi:MULTISPECIES: glycosyl hydrolase [unclassified Curtobacterium]|uniref:GH39 family glycosyl hydrolase n=1 Tax=unclassified Curtobacterium TaxID=257496 RepID=UPI0010482A19|nr:MULTISPECIES: glycosyl hydrolase [unclassified Curtobacterium]TCL76712.1 glycosyl hydrolase family 39 [Curtobacterium sp. PhB128]TCL91347.1 glycosyl hydrolase family 39 [Curtobacterium sp. PhB138]TCU44709.1 glycosyl hydrolase family 39 [Curtobacterium sp. PhB146]